MLHVEIIVVNFIEGCQLTAQNGAYVADVQKLVAFFLLLEISRDPYTNLAARQPQGSIIMIMALSVIQVIETPIGPAEAEEQKNLIDL